MMKYGLQSKINVCQWLVGGRWFPPPLKLPVMV